MKKMLFTSMSALVLSSALLAGCSQNGAQTNNSTASAKPAEPIKINAFLSGSSYPGMSEDFILKQLNQTLSMDLQMNVVATDYDQQLNVKIAGGTAPDIFAVSKAQLENYAKQGLLLDLTAYLDKMPNLKAKMTADDLNKGKVDGKQYAIARRPYLPMSSMWIRKDWLDKLGLQPPKTLEELLVVADAFTNKDPDGNGKKDTYGLTGTGVGSADSVNSPSTFDAIFSAFGVPTPGQFMIKDNKAAYSTVQPEMKQALMFINDMVSKGLVDPEVAANKGAQSQEKAFKGLAGMVYINWGEMTKEEFVAQYKAINPSAQWIQLDALSGPGGKYEGYFDIGATGGRVAISKAVEKDQAKLNKILEYLNHIADGKGYLTVMYGIEGTHYKLDNDNVVVTDSSKTGFAFNHQLTGRDEKKYLTTKFPKQTTYIDFAEKLPRISTYSELIPNPAGVTVSDKNRFENEEIIRFIFSKRPLSEFDAFVKTLESTYQLQKYVDSADKTLRSLGYIK